MSTSRLVVGALAFSLLAIACLFLDATRIEDDIRTRSLQALASAGLADVALDVSGRDLSISGRQMRLDQANVALATVTGIRRTTYEAVAEPAQPLTPPSPPAAREDTMEERIRDLLAGRPIRFRTGSAQLLPQSQAILDDLAPLLRGTDLNVEIEGHTDATGSARGNLRLSQRRAESVLTYLAGQGVSASQMTATGVGAARPITTNGTAAGRQTNRRIEFNVTSPN